MGVAFAAGNVGGMVAPLILMLDTVNKGLPFVVFGVLVLASGISCAVLPETMGKMLPQTVEDTLNLRAQSKDIRNSLDE